MAAISNHEDDIGGGPSDVLESRDFYEVCQRYRHAKDGGNLPGTMTAVEAFEALKRWIRSHGVVSVIQTDENGWLP